MSQTDNVKRRWYLLGGLRECFLKDWECYPRLRNINEGVFKETDNIPQLVPEVLFIPARYAARYGGLIKGRSVPCRAFPVLYALKLTAQGVN